MMRRASFLAVLLLAAGTASAYRAASVSIATSAPAEGPVADVCEHVKKTQPAAACLRVKQKRSAMAEVYAVNDGFVLAVQGSDGWYVSPAAELGHVEATRVMINLKALDGLVMPTVWMSVRGSTGGGALTICGMSSASHVVCFAPIVRQDKGCKTGVHAAVDGHRLTVTCGPGTRAETVDLVVAP